MLAIVHVEDLFDLKDVYFVEAWSLVGSGIELGLDGLCFFASAHIFNK